MRKLFVICWLFLGCTHIRVAEFDTQSRTFTVAGGRHAEPKDFDEKAEEFCRQSDSRPTLLGCGEGTRSTAFTVGSKGNYATTVANPHDAYRCRYQCQ